MGFEEFEQYLNKVASEFRNVNEPIKVVSNLDADGISAAAIMVSALKRMGINHSLSIIHQLREQEITEFAQEDFNFFVFTDLGSGSLDLIQQFLPDKKVLVLDHHHPHGEAFNVVHVNPHLFDIDGSEEVSASGVTFFFCRAVDKANEDMAHVALIGAIGDVQENDGFHDLNKHIFDIAMEKKLITCEKGLKFYGMRTRPIHKLLEYSSDLKIPGVSNSESGAIQFLQELNIDPKDGYKWKLWQNLTEDEKKKITASIIIKRANAKIPFADDIFGNIYSIPGNEGVFADLKEFSTLLNACGRLGKAAIGVGACLGDEEFQRKALAVHAEYKKELVTSLKWFDANKETDKIKITDDYVIINAGFEVKDTMIGTLASILSMGNKYPENTMILSIARKPDKVSKISLRIVGQPDHVHLRAILKEITKRSSGECGGHQYAAGAIVPTDKEDAFLRAAEDVLEEVAEKL